MKRMNPWKLATFTLLGVVLVLGANVALANDAQHAKIALKNLMTAEMNIEKLPDDPAGNRSKALSQVRGAVEGMRAYLRSAKKR